MAITNDGRRLSVADTAPQESADLVCATAFRGTAQTQRLLAS